MKVITKEGLCFDSGG